VGSGFRFECDMTRPLVGHIPFAFDLVVGERSRLLLEPTIGSVIPDMLFGIWSGDLPPCHRLNPVSRHIFAWLSERRVASSEAELRENLFLSDHATSSAVSSMVQVGAITKGDSGEVLLRPAFDVLRSVRLIAIEMKLKRWREALEQAVAYQRFADEAYVVLDGDQVSLSDQARQAFVSSGVGLFLHYAAGFSCDIPATRVLPDPSADRVFALSKLMSGPYCFV
jgi:hypothetical protein